MFDWQKAVAEKLAGGRITRHHRNEVVAEIAAHMEEKSQCLQQCGMTEDEARAAAWNEVPDWEYFAQDIYVAKEGYMTSRVKSFWIPGAMALLSTILLERFFYVVGSRPWIVQPGGVMMALNIGINPVFPALLPACGAIAAWMARRAGAPVSGRMLAATFPCLLIAACITGTVLLGLAVDLFVPGYMQLSFMLQGLAPYFLAFVIVPGVSLLLGALPFLPQRAGMRGTAAPATLG
jgi:hypothetical protein